MNRELREALHAFTAPPPLDYRSFPLIGLLHAYLPHSHCCLISYAGKACEGCKARQLGSFVKANLLLTHFGNLKWTHPHGGERESVFLRSERTTPLICSAMAAQSVPSEEPGIKVAPLLFALLTPGSSDGLKNAPIAFSKKTTSCFFAQEE